MKNLAFVVAMMLASAMNLARVLLAAALLSQDQFGLYTAALGAVGLMSLLIGFGAIDATTKYYPRLWVAGRADKIRHDARATALLIGLRIVVITAMMLGAAILGWLPVGPIAVLILGLFVWVSILLNLSAAMIRAVGSMRLLVTFSTLRGILPLVLVLTVLVFDDWLWAIGAELTAAAAVVLTGLWATLRYMAKPPTADPAMLPQRDLGGGRRLYLANLMSSSISLGDRALVTALMGPLVGGAYGVTALVVQSGSLLAGVLSQKFGPDMIRALHRSAEPSAMVRILRFPLAIMALAGMTVALVMLGGPMVSTQMAEFLAERGIGPLAASLSVALVVLQAFLLLQFAVVAQDNETAVIRSSLMALVVFVSGFALSYGLDLGIEGFIASVLAARLVQILNLARIVLATTRVGEAR